MSQAETTIQDVQASCKTLFAESTQADANSRSFNILVSRTTTQRDLKKQFSINSESRVPKFEEEQPLKKKGNNSGDLENPSKTVEIASKKQKPTIPEKPLHQRIEQRKREVKKILSTPSLREKFSHLLPEEMKLKLGYLHYKLINKMACIDRCITILNKNTDKKYLTIPEVQKHVKVLKETVDDNDIRQIVFLCQNFGTIFHIQWMKKQRTEEFQLIVRIPSADSYNENHRKCLFRKTIFKFLMSKYSQHLKHKSVQQKLVDFSKMTKWEYNFNVDDAKIPLGHLPEHPLQKKLSVSNMKQEDIDNITNDKLKRIIEDTIETNKNSRHTYEQPPVQKSTIFKNKLYLSIKAKQEMYEDEKKLQMIKQTPPQKDLQIKFCEQACALFIERRVSTMFRINFLDLMKKRMGIAGPITEVEDVLDQIINMDVKFLSKIQSPRGVMIQITKDNYNQMVNIFRTV